MAHGNYKIASKDFYPRSPCGERPVAASTSDVSESISIHALLAESDTRKSKVNPTRTISIHALLAESDATQQNTQT